MSTTASSTAPKRLAFFERYLTLWVFLCMVAGVAPGKLAPGLTASLSKLEFGQGLRVAVPIVVLIERVICPMIPKVDFNATGGGQRTRPGFDLE